MSVRNKSVWEPKSAGAAPEIHEDSGMFSYDKAAQKIILRQFHIEGFVNTYVCEPGQNGVILVCTTREVENLAPGWRARESYRLLSSDEIEEVFSLAEPGKDFEVYSRSLLKRAK